MMRCRLCGFPLLLWNFLKKIYIQESQAAGSPVLQNSCTIAENLPCHATHHCWCTPFASSTSKVFGCHITTWDRISLSILWTCFLQVVFNRITCSESSSTFLSCVPADVLLSAMFYAMMQLARKHNPKDTDYRSNPGACSAVCRLRHPAKHMRCLADVLRKFLLMRPILPKFLVDTVHEWESTCPPLFSGLPKVATITRNPQPLLSLM